MSDSQPQLFFQPSSEREDSVMNEATLIPMILLLVILILAITALIFYMANRI